MKLRGATTLALALFVSACNAGAPPAAAPAPAFTTVTSSEVTGTVPRNAIVTLLPPSGPPPSPDGPAVMDQYAKQFVPTVLIVRVGQPVEFRNSEDMPHNVSVTRRGSGTEVFNVGTDPHHKYVHAFDRVGQFDVMCDIHEGMEATVIVASGPVTTIAADDGKFSIPNVALGSYKLSVTFDGQTVEQAIDVKDARTAIKLAR
jgi:plastocyanin